MQSRSSTPHLTLLFVYVVVCVCFFVLDSSFLMDFTSARSEILCFVARLLARLFARESSLFDSPLLFIFVAISMKEAKFVTMHSSAPALIYF